eukprot:scaffold2845_cov444-Prasinococcus_capsulatus_cf.AAC.2
MMTLSNTQKYNGLRRSYFPPERRGRVLASRQYLTSILCDQQSVLELGTSFAVCRCSCPAVRPQLISVSSQVDHRLNRETVAHFAYPARLCA